MDIDQIRKDTPYCEDKLFLNSAGSSLMPTVVVEKTKEYLEEEQKLGGYKVKDLREAEINEFYTEAASLINCEAHNIAFTHDATDAYAKALSSIDFKPGDKIVTSNDDYISNQINFLSFQKRLDVEILRAKNLANGDLDLEHIENLIRDQSPKLVAITHIPTNSGLVQDVEAVGRICEKYERTFLVDACQSVGQIPVDVTKIKCDFLSTTGRKYLRGPRGSGFLFVSDKMLKAGSTPLFVDMRGADWTGKDSYEVQHGARRFETWESPYALIIGFKEAIKYANQVGIEAIHQYNTEVIGQLRENLSAIPEVRMFDKGSTKCNLLTFTKEGKSLKEIENLLTKNRVYYSISEKSSAQIDFEKKGIEWAIRLSPHYFNTIDEMNRVSEII
ncbi:MAG: aminotransferase class V-fold PLP-dependent enzyme, partial [Cyclobacteriaceae bacterium]